MYFFAKSIRMEILHWIVHFWVWIKHNPSDPPLRFQKRSITLSSHSFEYDAKQWRECIERGFSFQYTNVCSSFPHWKGLTLFTLCCTFKIVFSREYTLLGKSNGIGLVFTSIRWLTMSRNSLIISSDRIMKNVLMEILLEFNIRRRNFFVYSPFWSVKKKKYPKQWYWCDHEDDIF